MEWYEQLRAQYRPRPVEILLIAESPPDPAGGERRFFYLPKLSRHDNLYRGVAEAVYGLDPNVRLRDKASVLDRLRDDGYWLIDAVRQPINRAGASAKRRAVKGELPDLLARACAADPQRGVIVCHGEVYKVVAPELKSSGIPVLHDKPLPFPLGNWRERFVKDFRDALR